MLIYSVFSAILLLCAFSGVDGTSSEDPTKNNPTKGGKTAQPGAHKKDQNKNRKTIIIYPQSYHPYMYENPQTSQFYNPWMPYYYPMLSSPTSADKVKQQTDRVTDQKAKENVKPVPTTEIPKSYIKPGDPALRPLEDFSKTVHEVTKMIHDLHPENANKKQYKAAAGKGSHFRKFNGNPDEDLRDISRDVAALLKDAEDEMDISHHSKSPKKQASEIDELDSVLEDPDHLLDPSKRKTKTIIKKVTPSEESSSTESTGKKHHGGQASKAVSKPIIDFARSVHDVSEMINSLRPDLRDDQLPPHFNGAEIPKTDSQHHATPIADIISFVEHLASTVLDVEEDMDPEGDHNFNVPSKKTSSGQHHLVPHHRKHHSPAEDVQTLSKDLSTLVNDIKRDIAIAQRTQRENPQLSSLLKFIDIIDDMAKSMHHTAIAEEVEKIQHVPKEKIKIPNYAKDMPPVASGETPAKTKSSSPSIPTDDKNRPEKSGEETEEEKYARLATLCMMRSKDCQSCLVDNNCYFCSSKNACLPVVSFTAIFTLSDQCPLKDVFFMHACKVKFVTTIIIWLFAGLFALLIFIILLVFILMYNKRRSKIYKRIQKKERELLDAPEFANPDFGAPDFDE